MSSSRGIKFFALFFPYISVSVSCLRDDRDRVRGRRKVISHGVFNINCSWFTRQAAVVRDFRDISTRLQAFQYLCGVLGMQQGRLNHAIDDYLTITTLNLNIWFIKKIRVHSH